MSRRHRLLYSALLLGGCELEGIWVEPEPTLARMVHQKRYNAYDTSRFFADGKSMRTPPAGTIALEMDVGPPQRLRGYASDYLQTIPYQLTPTFLRTGKAKYEAYCAVCHGLRGASETVVAQNMPLVRPPSLLTKRLRTMRAGRIFRAIQQGYGLMPAYTDPLTSREMWTVVAYVRALQRSQYAPLEDLPAELQRQARQLLGGGGPQ